MMKISSTSSTTPSTTTVQTTTLDISTGVTILAIGAIAVFCSIAAALYFFFRNRGKSGDDVMIQAPPAPVAPPAPPAPVVIMAPSAQAAAPKKKKKQKKRSRDVEQGSDNEVIRKEGVPPIHIHLPPANPEAAGTPEPPAPAPAPAQAPAPASNPSKQAEYYNLAEVSQKP